MARKKLAGYGYYGGPVSGEFDDLLKCAIYDYCGVDNCEERICEDDILDEWVLNTLLKR